MDRDRGYKKERKRKRWVWYWLLKTIKFIKMTFPSCPSSHKYTQINRDTCRQLELSKQTYVCHIPTARTQRHTHASPHTNRGASRSTYFIPGCLSQCVMNTDGSWGLLCQAARQTVEQLFICPNGKYFVTRPRCPKDFHWQGTHITAAHHIKPPKTRLSCLWATFAPLPHRSRKVKQQNYLKFVFLCVLVTFTPVLSQLFFFLTVSKSNCSFSLHFWFSQD